jgi:hypothetical protein
VKLRGQISALQKEILQVSANRQAMEGRIGRQRAVNLKAKESVRLLKAKKEYLELQVREI